jgi:hypothetical protein
MDRRRLGFLAAAAVLLGLAFVVSRCAEDAEIAQDPEKRAALEAKKRAEEASKTVRYPRDRIRRTSDSPLATDRARPAEKAASDPILRAMAAPDGGGAVFAEVNAIRHSPLVEKMLRCREDRAMKELDKLKEITGIDVLEDVDRIALSKDGLAVSGFFDELQQPEGVERVEAYGDGGEIFEFQGEKGEKGFYATIGDGLVVAGDSAEDLRAAIDRVEGRASVDNAVPPRATNSEVYGRVGKAFIASLLQGANDPMAKQVSELVEGGVIRLNIDEHVSASLDVEANDPESGENLAKTIGGALSIARRDAAKRGDHELASLLEQARVLPGKDGGFGLDVAVPGETMLSMLGCAPKGEASPQGDSE